MSDEPLSLFAVIERDRQFYDDMVERHHVEFLNCPVEDERIHLHRQTLARRVVDALNAYRAELPS